MNVKLYSFAKRRNSTLRPNVAAGYDFEAIVNDAQTTICNPQLTLKGDAQSVLPSFNYVYIAKWNRYYYISDWRYMGNGLWVAYCNVDVLASWKEAIIATGGYVGRWVWSDNVSPRLHDGAYPATGVYYSDRKTINLPFSADPTQGMYVVGVLGGPSANYGAITYYAMTATQLATLVQNMAGQQPFQAWEDIDSIDADIIKSLVNPIQYIVSCKWFPFGFTAYGAEIPVYIWTWNTGVTGIRLSTTQAASMRAFEASVDPTFNPQATGNFPKYAPYWEATLFTPIWGVIDLPVDMLEEYGYYKFDIFVNVLTGSADLRMIARESNDPQAKQVFVFKRTAQLAVDIPLAQVSYNYVGMLKDTVSLATAAGSAVTGLVTETPITETIGSMANSLIDLTAKMLSPGMMSTGGNGGGFNYDIGFMTLQNIRYQTVGESFNNIGVPCKKQITSLAEFVAEGGGFVQFDIVHFKSGATDNENAEIEEAMKGGIFIE